MNLENIRNFVIIAHIDHGKSTLADRMLEITGTVEARKMKAQYLDQLDLERERGITIKMAPVRMIYHPNRGTTRNETQNDAESNLLFENITYEIRGAAFEVRKKLGLGHKESVYHNALIEEFGKRNLCFESEKNIGIFYEGKKVGSYQPDFVIDGKVIVELKALPEIGHPQTEQLWNYLKGSEYRLALLVNFGSKDLEIKRIVYDNARLPRPSASIPRNSAQVEEYILNLIDTPGHSDFSYEVSRALAAVEGAILLVDGTKGIQAQTLSNFRAAQKAGLKIIGAVNKMDLNPPRADESARLLAELIGVPESEILRVSGKTGQGVEELLARVVEKVPPPSLKNFSAHAGSRALIFDSLYDDHKGIIAFMRVFDGSLKSGNEVELVAAKAKCRIKEIGYFSPQLKPSSGLSSGEIGYIATGIKEPALVKIGDTVFMPDLLAPAKYSAEPLVGYREPAPVIFVSLYPDGQTQFEDLKKAFERLRLTDSALVFEPDSSEALGRGLKAGFLGQLHFEIATSRLQREFGLEFMASFPSTAYRVKYHGKTRIVKDPNDFPDDPDEVFQPMMKAEIFSPPEYLSQILSIKESFHMEISEIKNLGNNVIVEAEMPLSELVRNFDDKIKSLSSGFASFSYEISGESPAKVEKLEILVNDEPVSALARIVFKDELESEARTTVERLKELLPKQQFMQAVQAKARGRIIARESIAAMKKLLGNFGKTGGDRTRKMKLWKKQKEGKKKLRSMSRVVVPTEVFRDLLKK
ncbi:MAG TPA: translation elongation factor 4 [Candidatus Paceibacterota bacterium]|nr:translation elongation factor 4 [Candidatus Paceibacterota bacterium]